MADTGAPWNIPYAEPADLVRDWPDLSEDVADAVAAGLSAAGGVLQVVRATDSTNRTTTSTDFVDGSISVTITPTNASSNVIVFYSGFVSVSGTTGTTQRLQLQITDSSNVAISGAEVMQLGTEGYNYTGTFIANPSGFVIGFDSPGSTAAKTYKLRFKSVGASTTTTLVHASNTGQMYALEVRP